MSDLFETIIADAKIRDERDEKLGMKTKKEFQFGYIYGRLACYHEQTDCDIEEFINEINQHCSINLTLNMLASLMEIISVDEPEIMFRKYVNMFGEYVKVKNYDEEYGVGIDEYNNVVIIDLHDQDHFTNRMCENQKCEKQFDLSSPHYYDEDDNVCYCCEACYNDTEK